jgi:hypothetical protein
MLAARLGRNEPHDPALELLRMAIGPGEAEDADESRIPVCSLEGPESLCQLPAHPAHGMCEIPLGPCLLAHFPAIETPLRLIGAAYILYLAYSMLKASYQFKAQDEKPLGFNQGFLLQLLNPKLFVYALTLFTGFLAPITTSLPLLILAACLLAVVAFCATSGWALFGTVVKAYLRHPRVKLIVNIVLSLALVYTALELAGLV